MNRRIDRFCAETEIISGVMLLLTAMASDGGLALRATLLRTALCTGLLLLGAAGRALCGARGAALRRRLFGRAPAPVPAVLPFTRRPGQSA